MTSTTIAPSNRWFARAGFDLPWVLLTPLLVWPLVKCVEGVAGAAVATQLILLTATGHYFATFARTYGDRELFARFRRRLLIAPLLLMVVCVGCYVAGLGPQLLIATTAWAFWHWLAQAFGFARIYDIKAGSFRPYTAWLDKALVVGGFVGTVVLNPQSTAIFGNIWLDAGLPLPTAAAWLQVQTVMVGALAVLAVLYLSNFVATIVRGGPWSWQKQVMHLMTLGFYWFAYSAASNVFVSYVLYELFHDIQYYAITWLLCGQRAKRPGITPWFAAMFRPSFGALLLFLGTMLAWGGLDLFGRSHIVAGSNNQRAWLGAYLGFALLHYYFDGFIWKARERSTGGDLGITAGRSDAFVSSLRHGALWLLFFGPIALALWCAKTPLTGLARSEALLAVATGDFLTEHDVAFALVKNQQAEAALGHYERSIRSNGDFAPARLNYGSALELLSRVAEARAQYAAGLNAADYGGVHRAMHVNLAVLAAMRGERQECQNHARAANAPPAELLARIGALRQAIKVPEHKEQLARAAQFLREMAR